jgi:outer membrane murein-binding lipoprotein Lpp
MSDEAHDKPARRAPKKPARTPSDRPRKSEQPKAATATAGIARPARISVPAVPEVPAAPGALSPGASAVRLGLLTTTLAVIVGGFAWFGDAPAPLSIAPSSMEGLGEPLAITSTPSVSDVAASEFTTADFAASAPADPLAPHVRQSLEQDLRVAALALDLRESQESLSRLWNDAQSLAASVGALASGIDYLKADVGTARSDAAVALARLEERLQEVKVVAMAEPVLLGDPALRELTELGYPQFGERNSSAVASAHPEYDEAATTGGLSETTPPPEATVKVAFNKGKPRARASKPINGWHVHNAREDIAVVASQDAHYEVRAGELLPGAGIVRAIKKRGEQWVVLTSKGVITEAR